MQPPNLCIHFQRGFCTYGSNCRFLHQQVGAFASGGERFSGTRWTQAQGRGGRGRGQYTYYQEGHFHVSSSTFAPAQRPPPTREWSVPLNDADTAQHRPFFNFRFMSWNILADELAHSHASELYPQAHHTCLDWSRRLAAVVSHVETHRPDVLCLQEVDDWPRLRLALRAVGYDGVHLQRTGGRGDGCATMWLRDRLRLAGTRSGSGSGSRGTGSDGSDRSSGNGSGVHGIRMADHGLKDNVALLVHLQPRRGGTAGGGGGAGDSNSSSGSGSDVTSGSEDGSEEGFPQPQERPTDRRPKRTRQSSEGAPRAAAAAAAGLEPAAPARLQTQPRSSSQQQQQQRERQPSRNSNPRLLRHLRRGFWVANTHVLFNTKRGDIKLGQLRVILSELAARAMQQEQEEEAAREWEGGLGAAEAMRTPGAPSGCPTPGVAAEAGTAARSPAGSASMPVLFAGDFNAAPGSGLYRFLRYGALRLAEEDRRELSGQVEGYGYTQLQRDVMEGNPPRLTRWGPGPELRNQHNPSEPGAAITTTIATTTATGPSAFNAGTSSFSFRSGSGTGYGSGASGSSASSTQEWRQMRQGWQQHGWQQPRAPDRRCYSVRWEEEELVHAMGRVAVAQAVAAVRENGGAASSGGGGGGGEATAAAGAHGRVPPPGGNGYSNSNLFRAPPGLYGQGRGIGGDALWREQWRAVTETAVVRHPLQLWSAYAAVDEHEREPIFTTLHARYVGTVDFVWYTPGDTDGGDAAARGAPRPPAPGGRGNAVGPGTSLGDGDTFGVRVSGLGTRGFSLRPVRVLQPPDPLSYPYGMPCADWPSDHVSLVVDFRLS